GSATHLTGEMFKMMFGVDLLHIGYKSGGQAVGDVVAKQVDLVFDAIPTLRPHINGGTLIAYGVTGVTRSPLMPNVPTVAEQLGKEFDAYSWFGLLAPAGTPPAIAEKLAKELAAALADKEVRGQLETTGFDVLGTTPGEFAKTIEVEADKWAA